MKKTIFICAAMAFIVILSGQGNAYADSNKYVCQGPECGKREIPREIVIAGDHWISQPTVNFTPDRRVEREEPKPAAPGKKVAGDEKKNKWWEIHLSTSLQWDDNVILTPTGDKEISGVGGEDDIRNVDVFSFKATAFKKDGWEFGGRYTFYQSIHGHLEQYNLQGHMANIFLNYSQERWMLFLQTNHGYYILENDRLLNSNEFSPTFVLAESESWVGIFRYGLEFMDNYQDDAQDSINNTLSLEQWYLFGPDKLNRIMFGYVGNIENAEEDWYSNDGHKLWVGWHQVFSPKRLKLNLDTALSYLMRDYDEVNLTGGDTEARDDDRLQWTIALSRTWKDFITGTVSYTGTHNDSNLETFDYDRNIFALTLALDF